MLSLGYESDGHSQPFSTDTQTDYLYTQFGLTDRCELGIDVNDMGNGSTNVLNAKYLLASETADKPALAIGVMNVADGWASKYYAVGSRTFGKSRLFMGAQTQGDYDSLLMGATYAINSSYTLMTDYQSGGLGVYTAGVCWQATSAISATVYDCVCNDRDASDADYVGLNVAYKLGF